MILLKYYNTPNIYITNKKYFNNSCFSPLSSILLPPLGIGSRLSEKEKNKLLCITLSYNIVTDILLYDNV